MTWLNIAGVVVGGCETRIRDSRVRFLVSMNDLLEFSNRIRSNFVVIAL